MSKPEAIAIHQGHGLAAVADQLADLEALHGLMFRCHAAANDRVNSIAGVFTPKEIAASNAASAFGEVKRRTQSLTETLQQLLLQMEPTTLNETLSLALVYKHQMGCYHCDLDEDPASRNNQDMRDRERVLDLAVDAIIRGLVLGAGATSPLMADYICEKEELVPWDEQRRNVAKLAPSYPYGNHGVPASIAEAEEAKS